MTIDEERAALLKMAQDTLAAMFGAAKVAEYNTLSDLLSQVMSAWQKLRPPLT